MPDEDTQYVWSIKPVTFNDNPYKSGKNSFVKIGTFTVTNQNRGQTTDDSNSQGENTKIAYTNPEDEITKDPKTKTQEECDCFSEGEEVLSALPIFLLTKPNGQSVLQMDGLLSMNLMIKSCMSTTPEAEGDWRYNFEFWEIVYSTIDYDLAHVSDTGHAIDGSAIHTYDPHALAMPCVKSEQLRIEIKVQNKQLGFSCNMVFYKDIPENILNDIYGEKEDCNYLKTAT